MYHENTNSEYIKIPPKLLTRMDHSIGFTSNSKEDKIIKWYPINPNFMAWYINSYEN
jgi:hypothetical protein